MMTLAHLDREMCLLGFLTKENQVLLMDKAKNVVSYQLLESVLKFQTAIVRDICIYILDANVIQFTNKRFAKRFNPLWQCWKKFQFPIT